MSATECILDSHIQSYSVINLYLVATYEHWDVLNWIHCMSNNVIVFHDFLKRLKSTCFCIINIYTEEHKWTKYNSADFSFEFSLTVRFCSPTISLCHNTCTHASIRTHVRTNAHIQSYSPDYKYTNIANDITVISKTHVIKSPVGRKCAFLQSSQSDLQFFSSSNQNKM